MVVCSYPKCTLPFDLTATLFRQLLRVDRSGDQRSGRILEVSVVRRTSHSAGRASAPWRFYVLCTTTETGTERPATIARRADPTSHTKMSSELLCTVNLRHLNGKQALYYIPTAHQFGEQDSAGITVRIICSPISNVV